MTKLKNGDENPKNILSVEEACEHTSLSKSYLYKLTHLRKISHFKPGGKLVYFLKEDLDRYLLRNRVFTNDELESQAINYVVNGKGDDHESS